MIHLATEPTPMHGRTKHCPSPGCLSATVGARHLAVGLVLLAAVTAAPAAEPAAAAVPGDASTSAAKPAIETPQPAVGDKAAADPIEIELNRLEPGKDACRPYLVFRNRGDAALAAFTLELVLFDGEGFIKQQFTLDAAPLPAGKTSVKLFEIPGVDCTAIGRILLNQVTACAGADGALPDCMARIQASSRVPVGFFK
jgi:hypothetical protein